VDHAGAARGDLGHTTGAAASSSETAETEAFTVADAESQVREIARAIKTRLEADPTLRPSDCAIVLRRVTPHLALARRVFQEVNLPLDPAAGDRLTERPLGTWVLRLLRLDALDWRAFDLLDVAAAGFMDAGAHGVEADALARLRALVRRHRLWAGRDSIRRLPDVASAAGSEADARAASALSALIERIAGSLQADAIRRPGEHAAAAEALLLGPGGLLASEVQDYPTLEAEVQVLRSELASVRAVDEALSDSPERFDAFVASLEARLQRPATLIRQPGGVLLAPMHTLHGLRFRYVAVAGLNEGEFPAPRRAEGFLNTAARAALATAGLILPPEPRAAEAELWQTARTRATEVTTLWRTRLDAKGRQATPSFFLDLAVPAEDVRAVESMTPAERAASPRELAIALARGWPGEARRPAGMAAWDRVVRVAAPVEQRRRSYQPAGRHEGALPGLEVGWLLDPEAGWSASRLESYRTCPFQFFGSYVLGLREIDENQAEVDVATRGTVIHAILEDAVQDLAASERPLNPDTVEEAVARLHANARTIWDAAPARYAFGRAALWRYEGTRAIAQMERLLRREAAANALLPLTRVVGGEAAFVEVLPGDPPLRVQARIDRLDEGDGVIQIVDYKSGGFMRRKSAEEGDRLQLQIYAHAARQALNAPRVVARYAFLRLKSNESEWTLDSDRPRRRGDTGLRPGGGTREPGRHRCRALRGCASGGDVPGVLRVHQRVPRQPLQPTQVGR
jgi:ATP-dependent helicase/DNAse subunit B